MILATATPWSGVSSLLLPALGQTAAMVGIVMSIVVALGLPLGLLIFNTSPRGLTPHTTMHASISWIANLGRSLPFLVLMATVIPFTQLVVHTTIGIKAAIIPMSPAGIPFFARLVENAIREIPRTRLDVGIARKQQRQFLGVHERARGDCRQDGVPLARQAWHIQPNALHVSDAAGNP